MYSCRYSLTYNYPIELITPELSQGAAGLIDNDWGNHEFF